MGKAKEGKKINIIIIIFISIILTSSLIITVSPYLGVNAVPSWNDIFGVLGLAPKTDKYRTYVRFLDTGNSDCILIQSKGQTALIDSGDNSDDGKSLVNNLREMGIKEIDIAFVTHPHSDHIGGMDLVVDNFKVKELVLPTFEPEEKSDRNTLKQLKDAIRKRKITVSTPQIGKQYKIGDFNLSTIAYFLGANDENDRSVVLMASTGEFSFLLTGDAGHTVEQELLRSGVNLNADVIKLGHHGSKTASSVEFINAVNPIYAIATAGLDNEFGHPDTKVLDLLKSKDIKVYQTGVNGVITFYIDNSKLSIKTDR